MSYLPSSPAPAPALWHCSTPIEVVSRGHRLPKPYGGRVAKLQGCRADPLSIPAAVWPASRDSSSGNSSSKGGTANKGGTNKDSLSRHGLWFKLTRVYLQVRSGVRRGGGEGEGGGALLPQAQDEAACKPSGTGVPPTASPLGRPYYPTITPPPTDLAPLLSSSPPPPSCAQPVGDVLIMAMACGGVHLWTLPPSSPSPPPTLPVHSP